MQKLKSNQYRLQDTDVIISFLCDGRLWYEVFTAGKVPEDHADGPAEGYAYFEEDKLVMHPKNLLEPQFSTAEEKERHLNKFKNITADELKSKIDKKTVVRYCTDED
jgi:hypothetical protein